MPKDTIEEIPEWLKEYEEQFDWSDNYWLDYPQIEFITSLIKEQETTAYNKGVETNKKKVAEWAYSNARTKDTMMSDLPENHEWTVDYQELMDILTPLPEDNL